MNSLYKFLCLFETVCTPALLRIQNADSQFSVLRNNVIMTDFITICRR
jgi:hypothetical protein